MGTLNFANDVKQNSHGKSDIGLPFDLGDSVDLDMNAHAGAGVSDLGFDDFFSKDREETVSPGGDRDFFNEMKKRRKGVKTKYTDRDKKRMLAEFETSYVNDFGPDDPYHADPDLTAEKVNEILQGSILRFTYKPQDVDAYIHAMRKVMAVIDMLYVEEGWNLIHDKNEFRMKFRLGELTHQGLTYPRLLRRSKYPDTLLAEYIFDESKDPLDLKTRKDVDDYNFDFDIDDEDHPDEYVAAVPMELHNAIIEKRTSTKTKLKKYNEDMRDFIISNVEIIDKIEHMLKSEQGIYSYDANNYIDIEEVKEDMMPYKTFGTMSTEKGFEHNRRMLAMQKSAAKDPEYPTIEGLIYRAESLGFPVKRAIENYTNYKLGITRVVKNGKTVDYNTSTGKKVKNSAMERATEVMKAEGARILSQIMILNADPAFRNEIKKVRRAAKDPSSYEEDED
jgi:hypothetical protein